MRRSLSFLVLLALTTVPAMAQSGPGQGPGRGGRGMMGRGPDVEELRKTLNLDSAQTVAVRALVDTFRAETAPQRQEIERRMQLMRAARDGGASDDSLAAIRSGMRASLTDMQSRLGAFEDKVRVILRQDQMAAYDAWKKQQQERRARMQRGPGGM